MSLSSSEGSLMLTFMIQASSGALLMSFGSSERASEFFSSFKFFAFFGHVYISDGAELFGCIIRNTDVTGFAVNFDIFVGREIEDF